MDMFPDMLSTLFAGQIPVYIENNMELVIDIRFLFGSFTAKQAFSKDCGVNVQISIDQANVGPMACADNFNDLTIPSVGNDAASNELKLSAGDVAADEVEKGTQAKNVGLGIAMGVGYGLGLLLLGGASFGLFRLCRQGYGMSKEDGDEPNPCREMRVAPIVVPPRHTPEQV